MSFPSGSSSHRISLDEFIALTDEMAALVRAGVPLERGLSDVAPGFSRRSAQLVAQVAQRMKAGETLLQIIATSPQIFPPVYAAVLEAGIRSGRLPSALEGLASSTRRVADLRKLTVASLIYPFLLAILAYGLFLFSIVRLQPSVESAYHRLNVPTTGLNHALAALGNTIPYWAPLLPVAALITMGVWWRRSGRAIRENEGGTLKFLPTSRLLHYGRLASFADVLALLIEHEAPLGQSVVLAADASGDRDLKSASRRLAEVIERGGGTASQQATDSTAGPSSAATSGFPPVLAWLLSSNLTLPNLVDALRRAADAYRQRAAHLEGALRLYLPLGLILCVSCTSILLYALSVFLPWYHLLFEIPSYA
ncbi:MAG TPA: type II secretion system F family protein [Pirellulales bacterium]|jgi:general secretion pathway protein F